MATLLLKPNQSALFHLLCRLLADQQLTLINESDGATLTVARSTPEARAAAKQVAADPDFRRALAEASRGEFVSLQDDVDALALLRRDCPEAAALLEAEFVGGGPDVATAFAEASRNEFVSVRDDVAALELLRRHCPNVPGTSTI